MYRTSGIFINKEDVNQDASPKFTITSDCNLLLLQVVTALKTVPKADLYILEEQSHRLHNQGFMGISLKLRCLEAMIYATLSQQKDGTVQSILPSRVSSYFELVGKGTQKKKAAVELVRELVEQRRTTPLGQTIRVPEELREYFLASKKKDDLSDCLLQGLSLLDWSNMCKTLASIHGHVTGRE